MMLRGGLLFFLAPVVIVNISLPHDGPDFGYFRNDSKIVLIVAGY